MKKVTCTNLSNTLTLCLMEMKIILNKKLWNCKHVSVFKRFSGLLTYRWRIMLHLLCIMIHVYRIFHKKSQMHITPIYVFALFLIQVLCTGYHIMFYTPRKSRIHKTPICALALCFDLAVVFWIPIWLISVRIG